jgi:Xaa-Pro aminopeptidase
MQQARLIEIDWPDFGTASPPPRPAWSEFQMRLDALRSQMEPRGLAHLVVYGDREHFANLAYLTGFDPRFEEALLIVGRSGSPLLVVGNECEGYLPASPLYVAGRLRGERYQPFSLLNQPRGHSRLLADILAGEGIGAGARVGCAGWKYRSDAEHPSGVYALDLPAYIVDTLRDLAGRSQVTDATDLLMHPDYGLRTVCSPGEIAYFEYTNVLASEAMKRMLFGLREGMTDHEVVELARLNGVPLSCHLTFATGANWALGLSSPTGETLHRGEPISANVAYWGSNSCRAGWVAAGSQDLPSQAQDYVASFAGPYFAVMGLWLAQMRLGAAGDDFVRLVEEHLPFDTFGIFLNPGHLIHLDEWVSSPIYRGSGSPIRSGMVIQIDVIPASPIYGSTRMEDGIVVADAALRGALASQYPECYARCQRRRAFMQEVLGFELAEEVLPLSNMPGLVPPFWLNPHQVFAL